MGAKGKAGALTPAQMVKAIRVSRETVKESREQWRENAPRQFRDLLDAKPEGDAVVPVE